MSKTLQELATEARGYFNTSTRDNGDMFWKWKEGAPEWIAEMCYAAHGNMLADDWKYQFIVDALDALASHDDADEAQDSLEADVYSGQLLAWLASNLERPGYCDEAREEFGVSHDGSLMEAIRLGQLFEMHEVFSIVRHFLEECANADNE